MLKKKVLILCYDFPPLNTVGALRPSSWHKELYKYNIHPVIITRNWSSNIKYTSQKFSDVKTKTEVLSTDQGTIIKSAYKPDLKSRIIVKHGFHKYSLVRKFLTTRDFFLGPFIKYFDEYYFIYKEAYNYLSKNNVDLIIATGSPFGLFKQAHLLSKKFNTKWMADYRDPFTSNWSLNDSTISKYIEFYKVYLEKKWTKNAIHFTTVSSPFIKTIGHAISKNGSVIRNGFDSNLIPADNFENPDEFRVTYVGTIYNSEYLDILEDGIKLFLNSQSVDKRKVKFQFVGIELNHTSGTDRILKLKDHLPDNIEIEPSCSNRDALLISNRSNVLLNLNYGSHADGIMPVKLYEYLALKKPIINIELSNKDEKGEFDDYLYKISNQEEFSNCLLNLYRNWELNIPEQNDIPQALISQFSRSNQTKLLALLINKLV